MTIQIHAHPQTLTRSPRARIEPGPSEPAARIPGIAHCVAANEPRIEPFFSADADTADGLGLLADWQHGVAWRDRRTPVIPEACSERHPVFSTTPTKVVACRNKKAPVRRPGLFHIKSRRG